MAVDHHADIRKYDAGAATEHVDKIVKHLGIALRNRDSSLVSFSDPEELKRIKAGFMTRKLGITDAASADAALQSVEKIMAGDRTKSRPTVYYLLAKHFDKLGSI